MDKNPYWSYYILLIFAVVISYTAFTAFKVYQYSRLSEQTSPHTIHWSSHKIADDDYVLESVYEFNWQGKSYNGHMSDGEHFLNSFASNEALDRLNKRTFTVWFDPAHPTYSTLDRAFPIKYCVYTLLLWLLFFYFIWIGRAFKIQSR